MPFSKQAAKRKATIKLVMPTSPTKQTSTLENMVTSHDPRMCSDNALDLNGSAILVRVGHDVVQDYIVHRNLICKNSNLFKMIFTNECVESRTGTVTLKEDDPAIFEIYLQWLYTGKILVSTQNRGGPEYLAWDMLAKAYFLGDRFRDGNFVDAIMDTIIAESNTVVNQCKYYPIGHVTAMVYENTVENSPLRRLIIDQHVHHGAADWISESANYDMNKEFLVDLVKALFDNRPKPLFEAPDQGINTCSYHAHETTGKPCCKSRHQKE